jgi:rRNA-processing protein FCF1
LHNNKSDTKKVRKKKRRREKRRKNQILMDKQFLMFAVNNDLTLFVSLEINDGSEKEN